jgi:hypothetical protein
MRLMSWTVTDDDGVIQVRASIDVKTQQAELAALIASLIGRAVDDPPRTGLVQQPMHKIKEIPHG